MRNSQRAVVAALGLVVAIIVALAAWIRLTAEPIPELSGERSTRTYDDTGFTGVEISGQWDVTVERGDAWRVTVDVPAELADEVEAERRGDRFSLSYDGGWWAGGFDDGPASRATITMPVLASLDMSGTPRVSFSGFQGVALSVDLSGAGELRGAASRFDDLTLDVSGAGNLDLSDVSVTNADVDVSGVGNIKLQMAGGRLTGDMSGPGNLEYSGTVSEEIIDKSGFVNVRRRN